jgi:tRNA-splicing ligase RtcB
METRRIGDVVWELEPRGGMRVPGRVFATPELFEGAAHDRAVEQVANVAHLPGITGSSFAMPDIHWGYGFPIGGVAATDVDEGGVVSPGGVGFDICCGVRLLASGVAEGEFRRRCDPVMAELDARIPRGLGEGSIASRRLLSGVLERGAVAALDAGFGTDADLARCEERGTSPGARPDLITRRALERGGGQLGSLGAGNHFLAMRRYGIAVPDRQLACVPVDSDEGRRYLGAMAAAANFAWANRHVLAHEARLAFAAGGIVAPLELVFDVAHNLAKLEDHDVDGRARRLCVHRKGATRAFGPGHPDLPDGLEAVGQPVLVPGSMGTASWVLAGTTGNPAWASAAHGAGRVMSRKRAKAERRGSDVRADLEAGGIAVRPGSVRLLSEEAPYAYKDVDEVVSVCDRAGLARPVARLRPLGVVKG